MSFINLIFETVIKMSWGAVFVIPVVLLCRLLLRRNARIFSYALWGIVALRLTIPVMIPSEYGLFGVVSTAERYVADSLLQVDTGSAEEGVLSGAELSAAGAQTGGVSLNGPQSTAADPSREGADTDAARTDSAVYRLFRNLWLFGAVVFLIYGAAVYLFLRRRLRFATKWDGIVYESGEIRSPFVFGIVRPRIYLPCGLTEGERECILRHERQHIRRRDYLVKLFAYVLLSVYWFHPLVWTAYILMERDMEMSCDEKALSGQTGEEREAYAALLLSFAGEKWRPLQPLSFGEGDVSRRIRRILNYRRPGGWRLLSALLLVLLAAAFCLTDAANSGGGDGVESETENPTALVLYESRNPYVGDVSANGRLMGAIEQVYGDLSVYGTATTQLLTAAEPYTYILHFELFGQSAKDREEQTKLLDDDMWRRAVLFLALTDNCGEVRWDYSVSGELITHYVSVRDAEENLSISDLKAYGGSAEKVAELLKKLEQT